MIVLNLSCSNGHAFEGWFASREAFDGQCARGMVHCAQCSSDRVTAMPSGPRVLRHAGEVRNASVEHPVIDANDAMVVQAPAPEMAAQLARALAMLARTAENVGARFPEEARRIHYDEAPARTIRGISTPEQTLELLEEGILILPAPGLHESDLH